MKEPIVRIEHLSHRYSIQWAIRDISFELPGKGIYGLLGSNGAGKSTTMNIISGVIKQTEGKVFINGIDTRQAPVAAKRCIGFLPQKPPLYGDLTVEEYLQHSGRLRWISKKDLGKAVDEVYVPTGSDQNYCIASPIASDDGAVYYWNDSGALFAVKKSEPAAPGDIDADGEITTSDARLLLRMAVHLDKMPQQILSLGDINKDGAITTADARLLLRQAIGLDGGGVL